MVYLAVRSYLLKSCIFFLFRIKLNMEQNTQVNPGATLIYWLKLLQLYWPVKLKAPFLNSRRLWPLSMDTVHWAVLWCTSSIITDQDIFKTCRFQIILHPTHHRLLLRLNQPTNLNSVVLLSPVTQHSQVTQDSLVTQHSLASQHSLVTQHSLGSSLSLGILLNMVTRKRSSQAILHSPPNMSNKVPQWSTCKHL